MERLAVTWCSFGSGARESELSLRPGACTVFPPLVAPPPEANAISLAAYRAQGTRAQPMQGSAWEKAPHLPRGARSSVCSLVCRL